jgi:thiol-disulfide isomerase/thioredoxin
MNESFPLRNTFKILLQAFFILISSCIKQLEEPFLYEPSNPKPGDVLTIKYFYSNTITENKEAAIIVYTVYNGIINAEEYSMERSSTGWERHYHISDSTQALSFKFIIVGSEFSDQIKQKTYTVQLYGKDEKLLKGTRAASAFIIGHGSINNKKPDNKRAYKLYQEEFTTNPSVMKYYIRSYAYLIYNSEGRGSRNAAKKIEDVLAWLNKSTLNEEQMLDVLYVYNNYLKDEQKGNQYSDLIVDKYPMGSLAQREEINKIYNSDIEHTESLLKKFKEKFPHSENLYPLEMNLLIKLCKQKNLNEVKEYLKNLSVTNNDKWTKQYATFAQCAEICSKKNTDFAFIENLNDVSIRLARKFAASPRPDPNWLTENQYREKVKGEATNSSFCVAAKIFEKNKKFNKALKIAEEGYKLCSSCSELNLIYAKLLIENNKSETALKLLSQLISNGETSNDILQMFRFVYLKVKGNNDGYEKYLASLKENFLNQYTEEIISSLIKKPAPQFSLKDIRGKKVSLSDFKGEVVVLEFWATWCQHCKASFPLLKKALTEYSRNSEVKFLFVNTWENSKNSPQMVTKYLRENDYPFDCIIDQDNKISADYEITGLPTKIFIDPKGYIRYKSVGFDSSKMLDEIETIVKLIYSDNNKMERL